MWWRDPEDPNDPDKNKKKNNNNKERKKNTHEDQVRFIKEIQKNGYRYNSQYDAYEFMQMKGCKFETVYPKAIFASKDMLHFEIEIFAKNGDHLGAIDPVTRTLIKKADPTRNLFKQARR